MSKQVKISEALRAAQASTRRMMRHTPTGQTLTPMRRGMLRALVAGLLVAGWLGVLLVTEQAGPAAPVAAAPAAAAAPSIGGCQIFPPDNIWNTRIDTLPVHARSAAWISSIGASTGLKADFGSGLYNGNIIGIPYTTAPGSQPAVSIGFDYDDESDPGPYRLPSDAPVEGGGDRHVLVVDRDRCLLTEVYAAVQNSPTSWSAGSGALFDLNSHALRPDGWTSADAAGLPVLPGLARYDEIAAGEIAHALRFTAQVTQRAYLWPARHHASSNTSPNVPPMGARVRLKSSVNVSSYPPEVRIVLVALQRYGMFLADNGSNWYISGAPDSRWDNDNLQRFRNIVGSNLEFVDESALMVSANSGQARSSGPAPTSTPVPTVTPVPSPSCSPRPAAQVTTARSSAGRLGVTVTPGTNASTPSNRVRALRFGTPSNARILVNGQPVAGGSRVAWSAAGPATFTVERIQPGSGAMVPFVVEDDCGDWSSFVGGGASAF